MPAPKIIDASYDKTDKDYIKMMKDYIEDEFNEFDDEFEEFAVNNWSENITEAPKMNNAEKWEEDRIDEDFICTLRRELANNS